MIYFSSELIVKSIWSEEKTSTQVCHEKQGNRGSFPSRPARPGEAGTEKDAAALSSQKAKSATLRGERSVQGLVIPLCFLLSSL